MVERVPSLVRPRVSLTDRAVTGAIGQLRWEHAAIEGLAVGMALTTLWYAVRPCLDEFANDVSRMAGAALNRPGFSGGSVLWSPRA